MLKNQQKDFKGWIKIKEKIHYRGTLRSFSEGEIWWCNVGENVGSEICGKGKDFLRPILVINKLSKYNFIGIPLTSKEHHGTWYTDFIFQNKKQYAVVAQIENVSVYRLHHKIGRIPEPDLNKVIKHCIWLLASKIK